MRNAQKPIILQDTTNLPETVTKVDTFEACLRELFFIENPEVDKRSPSAAAVVTQYVEKMRNRIGSVWTYYNQQNIALRIPQEDIYYKLRTARNLNLILPEEQERFRALRVGIVGLSVGSAVLSSLVRTGGPKNIKIADPDIIELTNLNRMNATLLDFGKNKTAAAAAYVWEIDPFAELLTHEKGLSKDSLDDFLLKDGKLDVFVDEMDDIQLKIASRVHCKKARIPVLMATDNGDSVIIDIERFDQEPNRTLFHGQLTDEDLQMDPQTAQEFVTIANKIIDPTYFTKRQLASVQQIGKTLSGVAQLGTAAQIAGAVMAYVIRGIANDYDLPSGRYVIGSDEVFVSPKQ